MAAKASDVLRHPGVYSAIGGLLIMYPPVRSDWAGLVLLSVPISLYAYFAHVDAQKKTGRSYAEIGDNCYLIGFIYTLIVITVTLLLDADKLVGSEGSDRFEVASQFLPAIGIGLGTSVYGMLLRLFLHHLGGDTKEVLDFELDNTTVEVRQLQEQMRELSQTSEQTYRGMYQYSTTFKELTEQLEIVIKESLAKMPDHLESIFDDIKKNVNEVTKQHLSVSKGIYLEASEYSNRLKQFSDEINETLERFREDIDAVRTDILMLTKGIDRTEVPKSAKALELAINNVTLAYKSSAKELKRETDGLKSVFDKNLVQVSDIQKQLERLHKRVHDTAEKETKELYKRLLAIAEEINKAESKGVEGQPSPTSAKVSEKVKQAPPQAVAASQKASPGKLPEMPKSDFKQPQPKKAPMLRRR